MRIKLLILFFVLSAPCMGKVKVVEKSAKKVPVWVNTTEENYIITSALTDDLEKSKNQCLDNVKKHIIDAVAQNVKSSSEGSINQESVNNEIVNFLDKFTYSYQAQSANVPYMTGVSISKVKESYWEKRQNTDTKKITYLYAVKYPFPTVELKKLVLEFEKQDKEMNEKYKEIETLYANIASVEQIDKAIIDLDVLIGYFFDDVRKNKAIALKKNYQQLYSNISFREISHEWGCYELALILNGKELITSQQPALKSTNASQLRAEQNDKYWKIYYNCDYCNAAEDNSISVSYRIGGKSVVYRFNVDVNQGKISVYPTDDVYLSARTINGPYISNIAVRMTVTAKSRGYYTIKGLVLDVPGLASSMFWNSLNIRLNGGNSSESIYLTHEREIQILSGQGQKLNMLKGYMEVHDEKGNRKRVNFSLPFRANW